ncbi:MAG TPA: hypothetical protein VMY42_12790 [Thermoguttaceae bacterium]|nr:hypothetical protein [Thermoguttaceae bacterium]
MLKRLWRDDSGAILSAELVLLMTVLVIGIVVGVKAVGNAVTTELWDVAEAIGSLDQDYMYSGTRLVDAADNVCASTDGSNFVDWEDATDGGAVVVCGINIDGEGL